MKLDKKIQHLLLILILAITTSSWAQDITVHDPVMIKQKDTYYLYCTGQGISVFSSKDLKNWNPEPAIFNEKPVWVDSVVPDFKNHILTPFISSLFLLLSLLRSATTGEVRHQRHRQIQRCPFLYQSFDDLSFLLL